jgi:hypothetical protein
MEVGGKIYLGKPLGLVSFGTESMLVWHRCALDPQREIARTGTGSQLAAKRCRRAVLGWEPCYGRQTHADGAKVSFSIL